MPTIINNYNVKIHKNAYKNLSFVLKNMLFLREFQNPKYFNIEKQKHL